MRAEVEKRKKVLKLKDTKQQLVEIQKKENPTV